MKELMNEQKQKFLSTLIVSIGSLLGFEAVSYIMGIYQLKLAIYVAFYIYAFHVLWLTFLFDLHLKKRGVLANARLTNKGAKMLWEAWKERCAHIRRWEYFRHYQNYLVLPGLLYWSTVILLFLNPFDTAMKQFIILFASFAMTVGYWYMKEHISRQLESRDHWIKVLSLVKLFGAFLVYSALLGTTIHFGFGADFLTTAVLVTTFLLVYQALFQHNLLSFQTIIWILVMSLALAVAASWVYSNWNAEYFTGGLVMLAVYNTLWGILHHHLEKTLSRRILAEYLLMTVFVISFLLASHNFNQRIV